MSNTISITPSGKTFEIYEYETILEASLRNLINLPYGCKDGACGSCKCKLISGDVLMDLQTALTDEDLDNQYILTCRSTAQSDVTLEINIQGDGVFPIKKIPTRIISMTRHPGSSGDIMIVQLQLPVNDVFEYRGGQYIDFILRDGSRRSYSMACAPHIDKKTMELHIRHMPGGVFTDQLFSSMKEKDILRVEGPFGSFQLQHTDAPIIMIASGTGFAPIKAMVEEIHNNPDHQNRPISFYWGVRRPMDLYMNELALVWQQSIPNFKYIPVISDAEPEDIWTGRTGFVHEAIVQDHPDLSAFEVYACGAPVMVKAAHDLYIEKYHMDSEHFFSDAFLTAKDKVTVNP